MRHHHPCSPFVSPVDPFVSSGSPREGRRFGHSGIGEGAVDPPLAWPLRNSHPAVEIIDEGDPDGLSRWIVAIAEEL